MRTALQLALAVALALGGCSAELASNLEEAQADDVVLALDEAGIGARKEPVGTERGRFRVQVAREELAPALAVLRDHHLPRERPPGYAEVFAERGLVPSASDERARHAAATAGELARSLESIDGVARDRVHLGLVDPSPRALDAEAPRPRAAVLIEDAGEAPVGDDAIRALVAGAVPELAAEDVAVVRTAAPAGRPQAGARLVSLGPITVTRGTEGALKAILASSFALNLVLVAAIVWIRRRGAARREGGP